MSITDEPYYDDYPKEKIGKRNPYSCCIYCKRSAPEINGTLSRHLSYCKYRIEKEKELGVPTIEDMNNIIEQIKKFSSADRRDFFNALKLEICIDCGDDTSYCCCGMDDEE